MQRARAVISLANIRKNALFFKERAGTALCAVVKADGYGHGAAQVASALGGTANFFAVSLVGEGEQLRLSGVREDILVFTPPLCEEEVLRGLYHGLVFTVGDCADYALLLRVCKKYGLRARFHFKVNTGMNRYGADARELARLLSRQDASVRAEGIYSHFYRPEAAAVRRAQFSRFLRACAAAEARCGALMRHIAATGGALADDGCALDAVRIGIGLYGYVPQGFSLPRGTLAPAMRVDAAVSAARRYRFGGAGYGANVPHARRLYTVRCGYADGLPRAASPFPRCMDAAVCEGAARKYGRVPVLTDADALAKARGTIAYEVLVNAGRRAERVYER